MCLPNFIELKKVKKAEALIGYRNWRLSVQNNETALLQSLNQDFIYTNKLPRTRVIDLNSGYYSYNNQFVDEYYNKNTYNYNYFYTYNNNYGNEFYNYIIGGITLHYGKVAIHNRGYRSEYIKIDTLFTIDKNMAVGSKRFLDWIDKFNAKIESLAKYYNCKTKSWQEFLRNNYNNN